MQKKDFFSKLNKKDFNSMLENILEKKDFSANTKNLLLSMLYKIEVSYKDYKKAKKIEKQEKEFIEEILTTIEKCEKFEVVEPQSEASVILEENETEAYVNKEKKRIIAYPTEKAVMSGILDFREKNFFIDGNYFTIKKPLYEILTLGNKLNYLEVITNFNGWSWNIELDEQKEIRYNLIYQNLQILLGDAFLENWRMDKTKKIDYIQKISETLTKQYGQTLTKRLFSALNNLLIKEIIENYPKELNKIINDKLNIQKQLDEMENKTIFLNKIYDRKKELNNKIKEIDDLINNKDELAKELKNRNKDLKEENKIFSVSNLVEILNKDRKSLMEKLQECNEELKPSNYIKKKNELNEKIKLIEKFKIEKAKEKDIEDYTISFQKIFLEALKIKTKKVVTKKEIVDLIYIIRYYELIQLDKHTFIKDERLLEKELSTQKRILIEKAYKQKVLNEPSKNLEDSIEITKEVLQNRIIDLEAIVLVRNDEFELEVYDGEILDNTIKLKCDAKQLNIKKNRELKVFI